MKITVARSVVENGLRFVIDVTEPHEVPFEKPEQFLLKSLQCMSQSICSIPDDSDSSFRDDIESALHGVQSMLFHRAIDSLKFSIDNELKSKFDPICQEIYNWIYDQQSGELKGWLQEFDPQRTKYYFDNDKTCESDYSDEEEEEDEN